MQGNILLVDDEIVNRKLLSIILKDEEFLFLHAENGLQALEIVARDPVDLIILDLMMPQMDGFQFMEEYRRNYEEPRIPIIVSSALDDRESIKRAIDLGAAEYFFKPLQDEVKRFQLPLKVRNLVHMKQLQLEAMEKQKMQAVMALAGTANHEINQPLMVILGNLQLLRMRTAQDDPLQERLRLLEHNTRRIAAIVKKIGNINKLTTKPYLETDQIIDLQQATSEPLS